MTDDLTFACGCKLSDKLSYGYRSIRLGDGEQVCPEHGEPAAGWRSRRDRYRDRINRHPSVETDVETEPTRCPTCGQVTA